MSTIPSGLRADHMRERMLDKATIQHIGGLYVGGTTSKTYVENETGGEGSTIDGVEITEIYPTAENIGLPLVSNGAGALPSYRQIGANAIPNHSITKDKLGAGTVVNQSAQQMQLNIYPDPNDSNVLIIAYTTI